MAKAPASAEALGAWLGAFWTGMELEMMLDIDGSEDHHREALQAMQELLVRLAKRRQRRCLAVRKKAPDRGRI